MGTQTQKRWGARRVWARRLVGRGRAGPEGSEGAEGVVLLLFLGPCGPISEVSFSFEFSVLSFDFSFLVKTKNHKLRSRVLESLLLKLLKQKEEIKRGTRATTTAQATAHGTSCRSDGSPPCLGGSSHGWVPVDSHSTPCSRKGGGCWWFTAQKHNMSPDCNSVNMEAEQSRPKARAHSPVCRL